MLYSLTNSGGTWTLTDLYDFVGGTSDGAEPRAGVIIANSVLYGTTNLGGSSSCGTLYSYNLTTSAYRSLYSFTGGTSDGCNPYAEVIYSGGVLYGTTYSGGSSGNGTVFTWQ